MDCFHKTITFWLEGDVEYVFQGEWIITPSSFVSNVNAEKMIKKGCMVWIVAVSVEKAKEENCVSDEGVLRCISRRLMRITS